MPITIFARVEDAGGPRGPEISTVSMELDPTTTIANVAPAVRAFAQLIDPLIAGRITAAGFTFEVDLTGLGLTQITSVLADVQEKATFAFRTAGGFIKRISLPTFNETLFVGVGAQHEVDLTDSDVAAFIDAMEDGIDVSGTGGTGVVGVVDSRDEDLTELIYANQTFVNRRG